jgi:hypothetical protein
LTPAVSRSRTLAAAVEVLRFATKSTFFNCDDVVPRSPPISRKAAKQMAMPNPPAFPIAMGSASDLNIICSWPRITIGEWRGAPLILAAEFPVVLAQLLI